MQTVCSTSHQRPDRRVVDASSSKGLSLQTDTAWFGLRKYRKVLASRSDAKRGRGVATPPLFLCHASVSSLRADCYAVAVRLAVSVP